MTRREPKPTHPGAVLRKELEARGISISLLTRRLGVKRAGVARILRGERGVSVEMAIRLGTFFNHSPKLWLILQQEYDLRVAEHELGQRVRATVLPWHY